MVGVAKDAGSLEAGLGVLAAVLLGGAGLASRLPFLAPARVTNVEPARSLG